jgi:hypothetical protein
MTTSGSGSGGSDGKRPPDWQDDPMHRPASDAGWDDAPTKPAASPPAASPPAASPPAPSPPAASPPAAAASPPAAAAAAARGMSFPAYVPSGTGASPAGVTASSLLKRTAGAGPATAGRDDPSLPETPAKYDESELRSAVGASPIASTDQRDAADDAEADDAVPEPRRRRSPRTAALAVLAIAGVVGTAVFVLLGHINSDRYVLACEPERAVPEQGRGFPPWGTRPLAGETWRPLPIAAETRCRPLETDELLVLQRAYLAMVLDQATAMLTAREVTKVDGAEALLKQALLLTRPPEREPEPAAKQRAEQHQEIERLLGDVAYWRAAAKVRDAAAALGDAAKQFDAAVAQHPRHVSDAAAWAAYVRKLAQDIHAGPASGATSPTLTDGPAPPATSTASPTAPSITGSTAERPAAPPGVALPVEPDKAHAAPAAQPSPSAPTGGVLL